MRKGNLVVITAMAVCLRQATEDELTPYAGAGHVRGFVLEEDGARVGSVFLCRNGGELFAFGWECQSSVPWGAALLYVAARRQARRWGFERFLVHFEAGIPGLRDFWIRRMGGKLKYEVFEVEV
jgi:hypothetical protein